MADEGDVDVTLEKEGSAALTFIKETEAVTWLTAQEHLSHTTRRASRYVFSLAKEYAIHCPLPHLLTVNFDAEQIWQQIDLQTAPLLTAAKRHVRHLSREPSLRLLDDFDDAEKDPLSQEFAEGESEDADEPDKVTDNLENDDLEDDVMEEEDASLSGDGHSESEEDGDKHLVEDKFLKLKDMEKFLDDAEAPQDSVSPFHLELDSQEELEEEDGSEDEESDEEDDVNMEVDNVEKDVMKSKERDKDLKYEDFFRGSKRKKTDDTNGLDKSGQSQASLAQLEPLTTHGRQLAKVQKSITELEKANLNPKLWTMQGEVTASKRPKNSALEVELDFEHNARPPPVITEEITASIEDMIRKRIAENSFDDVQRKPALPVLAPKEQMDLDENKSKKGLAELYEADYMQKTGLAPVSSSPADDLRKEATGLFKALCIKLDALSHFHFTPKPVIEDMAVRSDVPALAMEEVAPLMVSDAQMLAPEEHFTGEGVVKAETELTREERKRRRARKKEKGKAEKRKELGKNPGLRVVQSGNSEESLLPKKRKTESSHYSKSTKVFEKLDEANKSGQKKALDSHNLRAPFLKL